MGRRSPYTLDNLEKRLRAEVEGVLQTHPEFKDADGNPGGFVTSNSIRGWSLFLSFLSYDGESVIKRRFAFGITKPDDEQKERIRETVRHVLGDYNLSAGPSSDHPLTRTTVQHIVKAMAEKTMKQDAEFAGGRETQKGTFSITRELGRPPGSHLIKIGLRPYTDIERSKHEFVKAPHILLLTTGSSDTAVLDGLIVDVKEALKDMGLQDIPLSGHNNNKKVIPGNWIEPERMGVRVYRNKNCYIKIVIPRIRIPQIIISSELQDEARAKEAMAALRDDYIVPRIAAGESITIHGMQQWLGEWRKQKGYGNAEKVNKVAAVRRKVDAGNPPRCRFFAPNTVNTFNDVSARIIVAPWAGQKAPFSDQATVVTIGLNIRALELSSREEKEKQQRLIHMRTEVLNEIAIAAMQCYFTEHPGAQFTTTTRQQKRNYGVVPVHIIQHLPDISYAAGQTIAELQKALREDSAPPVSALPLSLYQAFKREHLNGIPSQAAFQAAFMEALNHTANSGDLSGLAKVMQAGLQDFFALYPHYHVQKNKEGEASGVEVNRANHIDADYMRGKILRPAIRKLCDYPRMIAWDIAIAPEENTPEKNKMRQTITLQALRNPFSETPEAVGEPVILHADTREQAYGFADAVNQHLYIHQLTGIPRPVEHFTASSQELVFKASLDAGLNILHGKDTAPAGKHVARETKRRQAQGMSEPEL